MTNLVKIEKDTYSFYEGREKIVKVSSATPLDLTDLEFHRENPHMLKLEMEYNYYAPRSHQRIEVQPETFLAMYYDNTEECKENIEKFVGIENWYDTFIPYLEDNPEGYLAKYSDGRLVLYTLREFETSFEEC